MIVGIEGKIGSGKTYFAVNHMLRRYFRYDDVIDDYVPIAGKPVVILTNVRDFRAEHISLPEQIDKCGMSVFSEEYVNSLRSSVPGAHVIYVIDEAQLLFDRKFYDKKVFGFFQMSRHFGVTVYLITQDIEVLSKELRNLLEWRIVARSRSLGVARYFLYFKYVGDEKVATLKLKRDNKVFRFYSSYKFEEGEKPKSVYPKYIVMFVLLVVFAFAGFKFFTGVFFSAKNKVVSSKGSGSSRPVASQRPVSPASSVSNPSWGMREIDVGGRKVRVYEKPSEVRGKPVSSVSQGVVVPVSSVSQGRYAGTVNGVDVYSCPDSLYVFCSRDGQRIQVASLGYDSSDGDVRLDSSYEVSVIEKVSDYWANDNSQAIDDFWSAVGGRPQVRATSSSSSPSSSSSSSSPSSSLSSLSSRPVSSSLSSVSGGKSASQKSKTTTR